VTPRGNLRGGRVARAAATHAGNWRRESLRPTFKYEVRKLTHANGEFGMSDTIRVSQCF